MAEPRKFRASLLKWLFVGIIISTVIFWAVPHLFLTTKWGREVLFSKLEKKTGATIQFSGGYWLPGLGVVAQNAQVQFPFPRVTEDNNGSEHLLTIRKITIQPSWKELFKKKKRPKSITLDQISGTLPLEAILYLRKLSHSPAIAALAKKQAQPNIIIDPLTAEEPSAFPSQPIQSELEVAVKPNLSSIEKPQSSHKKSSHPKEIPIRISIKNSDFKVISSEKKITYLAVNGLDAKFSIFGSKHIGKLNVDNISIGSKKEIHNLEIPLVWEKSLLKINRQFPDVEGANLKVNAILSPRPPFLFGGRLQAENHTPFSYRNKRYQIKITTPYWNFGGIFGGILLHPSSLRAKFRLQASELELYESRRKFKETFHEIYIPLVFERGRLTTANSRIIGDRISILGNGYLDRTGDASGVVRLVAREDTSELITRGLVGAGLVNEYEIPYFQPLETSERGYRDIYIKRGRRGMEVDFGQSWAPFSLNVTLRRLFHFLNTEMNEEDLMLHRKNISH